MTNKTLIKKLNTILKDIDNDLEKDVINEILEKDDPLSYISDVMRGGCQSGVVSSLIYYVDTKAFYITYMQEIDDLYHDTCEETGETIEIGTPMYNWLAWFGYEQTMFNLSNRLELNN